jgi:hypothetical protein
MNNKVFYFVPQTSVITHRRIQTNYYQYAIPEFYRGQVLAEAEAATLGPNGLEYPASFLEDLEQWDKQGRKLEHTR